MNSRMGIEALSAIRARWRSDGQPDALAYLAAHPECADDPQFVTALAYEEYCLRLEAGESFPREAFCSRFPAYQTEIRRLLEVHSRFADQLSSLELAFPPAWPKVGDQVHGFVLLEELGRGGFGRVFLAREPELGNRSVVVKFSCDGAAEANLLGPLLHPNIVRVHSVKPDADSGLTAVCMPYQGRTTLLTVLRRLFRNGVPSNAGDVLAAAREPSGAGAVEAEPLSPVYARGSYTDAVLHLGAQLAEALDYLHGGRIRHCDLKPANILITPAGRAVLLDFNLASAQEDEATVRAGTLPYMAPEQLRAADAKGNGQPTRPDARADLYALGVILYELLTGQHPFGPLPVNGAEPGLRQLLYERQRRGAAPVRSLNRGIPLALARLVEGCLAWNPADRPGSAKDVAQRLRTLLAPRRYRRLAVAAAAGFLLVGASWWYASASWLARPTLVSPPLVIPNDPKVHARRLFQNGLDSARRKDYQGALRPLTDALVDEQNGPVRAWMLYARGRSYQRLGDVRAALADYQEAFTLVPDWRIRACIGYCRNLLQDDRRAIEDHTWVLQVRPDCAAAFNNRGYSRLRCGDRVSLRCGLADVQEALRQDATLAAAHANRVRLSIQLLEADPDLSATLTWVEVDQTLTLGPPAAAYAFDLTLLCAETARRQPHSAEWAAWVGLGVKCAERALQLGTPKTALTEQRTFEQLARHPRFPELLQAPRPAPQNPIAGKLRRLVDPVPEGEEHLDPPQAVPARVVGVLSRVP